MDFSKKNYIYIAILAICIIFLGFLYNIAYITSFYYSIAAHITELWITVPAIVCAILFANNGTFWLTMIILSGLDAVFFRWYHGYSLTNITAIGTIKLTFLIVVFGVNLIKAIFRD